MPILTFRPKEYVSEFWENTGHLVFEDEPARFMNTLKAFLTQLPAIPPAAIVKWKQSFSPKDYRKPNQLQREFLKRR